MSANSSVHLLHNDCLETRRNIVIFTAYCITYVLLLPLFIFVLYVGFRRWRQQRSVLTAAMTSHSDIFTYNMAALELIGVLGSGIFSCSIFTDIHSVISVVLDMFFISTTGQTLLHLLTCVDRYLAVVHPIAYLGLRQAGGVRIRNISIGCAWLLCFGFLGLTKVLSTTFIAVVTSCFLFFSLIVVSFCSVSVLCVLIGPGPGEVDRNRQHVDQTKQRAFHTITAIMGALLLRSVGSLVCSVIYASMPTQTRCVVCLSMHWLPLPGSLVLPLLFLHRAGKLPGCKRNSGSG